MAILLSTDLTDQLTTEFPQRIASLVEREADLFNRIPKLGGEGERCEWQVNTSGNSSAAAYAENDAEPTAGRQNHEEAFLAWGLYWAKCGVTRHALRKAANNHSKIGDLVRSELSGKSLDLIRKLGVDTISGSGTSPQELVGLSTAIDSTGTYANLARATYTQWASYEVTITPPLTLANIRTATAALKDTSGNPRANIDFAFCDQSVFNILGEEIEAAGTGPSHMVLQSDGPGGRLLTGGWTAISYEGILFVPIKSFTAQAIVFVQSDQMYFKVLRDFMMDPPERVNDTFEWLLTWTGQLVYENTGLGGKILGISS